VGNTAAEDEVGDSHNWLPKWTVKLSEVPKGARLVREGGAAGTGGDFAAAGRADT
jgi:hypothetical protein